MVRFSDKLFMVLINLATFLPFAQVLHNTMKILSLPFNMAGLSYLLFFYLAFTFLPHPQISSSLIMEKQNFLFSVANFRSSVFLTLVRSNSATKRTRSSVSRICSLSLLISVSAFYVMIAGCYVSNILYIGISGSLQLIGLNLF